MLKTGKNRVRRLWQLLWRPSMQLGEMVEHREKAVAVSVLLLTGIVLMLVWADFVGLGSKYSTGQILSTALILGTLVGVMWALLLAFWGLCIGNLLLRSSAAKWTYHPLIPPFPLKNVVWRRLIGPEKLRRLFALPGFRHYLWAWSNVVASWEFVKDRLGGERIQFGQSFALVNRSMAVLTLLAPLLWIGMFGFGNAGFGAASSTGRWIGLAVEVAFILHFVWVWSVAFRLAYSLRGLTALLGAVFSLLFSLGSLAGILVFLTGIRLF